MNPTVIVEALIGIVLAACDKVTRDDAARIAHDVLAFFAPGGIADEPPTFAEEFQPKVDELLAELRVRAGHVRAPDPERITERDALKEPQGGDQ